MKNKKLTLLNATFLFSMYFTLPSIAMEPPSSAEDTPHILLSASNAVGCRARILCSGEGSISTRGLNDASWPEGYSLKAKSKFKVNRILKKEIGQQEKSVLDSWSQEKFTPLANYRDGQSLDHFTLVVHGLELKHLLPGIESESFDDFVKEQLNSEVPIGDDFIPYYPYFFHKKTIVSASVISESCTATFGNLGFILSVPEDNFLFGANKDIHSPTDKGFYTGSYQGYPSDGDFFVKDKLKKHPLPLLQDLISEAQVTQRSRNHVTKKLVDPLEYYKQAEKEITEESIKEQTRRAGWPEMIPEQLQRALQIARFQAGWHCLSIDAMMPNRITRNEQGEPEIKLETSVYNEVALIPASQEYKPALITGVFLRTAESNLQEFLKKNHVKKLMDVAKAFDLPVVFIDDGEIYNTEIGD